MPKVTISQGTLVGSKCKTANDYEYIEFLQIPYAEPPIGELRFKSPQPAQPWAGERDATTYDESKFSVQSHLVVKKVLGSEDCLYLNVYTPKLPEHSSKSLPVMVYIHGGAFMQGNGINKSDIGPELLIEEDVVIVTINYRLHVFGFLSLHIPEAAGNMALKDQVMALKWIQSNIEKFGGNKNNVTVFGISAGSTSIEYLLLSPSTNGLFHKAILQSGSSFCHWALNEDIKNLSIKLAQEIGYRGSVHDTKLIYQYLMEQPTQAISEASFKIAGFYSLKGLDFGFVPSIEKDYGNGEVFLKERPYDIIKEGKFNKVPVIRGFCEYEGYLSYAVRPQNIQELKSQKNFTDFWPSAINNSTEYNNKFIDVYSRDESDTEKFAIDFFTDYDIASGVWIASKMIAEQGVPVYFYMFSYDGRRNILKKLYLKDPSKKGAFHGDDHGYLLEPIFGHTARDFSETELDVLVSKIMVELWTNFAKTNNPTPQTSDLVPVVWPRFTAEEQQYLKIDQELTVECKYYPEKMAVFEEIIHETFKN